MSGYQITVVVMLALGLYAKYVRLSKHLNGASAGEVMVSALLATAISAVVPYCLYAGGFFK